MTCCMTNLLHATHGLQACARMLAVGYHDALLVSQAQERVRERFRLGPVRGTVEEGEE